MQNSLLISLLAGMAGGDGFEIDCVRHHAVLHAQRFPDSYRKYGQYADLLYAFLSPWRLPSANRRFWRLRLCASEFRFLGKRDRLARDPVRMWGLPRGQTERAILAGPFGRKFAKTRDTHPIGQASFNGRLDEVGGKEGKRERHVDLAHAAALSLSDRLNIDRRFGHERIQPPSSFRNRSNKECAIL